MPTVALTDPRLVQATTTEVYLANETIAIGNLIFLDVNDSANVAINNDAAKHVIAGIAITNAVSGQYVSVAVDTAVIVFAETLAVGQVYILADTAGAVKLSNEIQTGEFLSEFGKVTAANTITVSIDNTGAQAA